MKLHVASTATEITKQITIDVLTSVVQKLPHTRVGIFCLFSSTTDIDVAATANPPNKTVYNSSPSRTTDAAPICPAEVLGDCTAAASTIPSIPIGAKV